MKRYPVEFVARVRGALLAGICHKTIASKAGVSISTIHRISCGAIQQEIGPDLSLVNFVADWLDRRKHTQSKDASGG